MDISRVSRNTLVVIPLGSTEQHGPHLPVSTDALTVTALAKALEKSRGILLAPTQWLGHSPHHLSFGGTLSMDHEPYAHMLVQTAKCFAQMGFVKLLFLNGHGGNHLPVSMALQRLKQDVPDMFACGCEYWQPASGRLLKLRESPLGGMGHACELETSLCLHLKPELVRRDLIADGGKPAASPYFRSEMFQPQLIGAVSDFKDLTQSGVYGMPSLASSKKGKLFFDAILDSLENLVDDLDTYDSPWPYQHSEEERP
jgi:creatinine amidohydrolase